MNRPTKCCALVALVCVVGCSGSDGASNSCPSGTKPFVDNVGQRAHRTCLRPDGTAHGPAVDIDEQGHERVLGLWVDGKRQGQWLFFAQDSFPAFESTYDAGVVTRIVRNGSDGKPNFIGNYRSGVANGSFFVRHDETTSELEFANGYRSGTWTKRDSAGVVVERRAYGLAGVLQQLDGYDLPAPPKAITLPSGTQLERAACGLATNENVKLDSPCLDLFEAMQRCERTAATMMACHSQAIATYVKSAPLAREP